jgi:hypothetical protein
MIKSRTQSERSVLVADVVLVVVVAATGAREARGCRRGGLSVPKPPKGSADGDHSGHGHGHGHGHGYDHDPLRLSRD